MESILLVVLLITFALLVWQTLGRRKSEVALQAMKEQMSDREGKIRTILGNAPIVFSAVDMKGVFHISEGKGLEKLGRKDNESIGINIFELHDQNPVIVDAVKRAMTGERVTTSFVLRGISFELFLGPELDAEGKQKGVSMLSVDVTDRKKIEDEKAAILVREKAALETSKLKSQFLANMSHEIRTPMNGVLGMASLLLNTKLLPEQREFAEAIKISGDALLRIINDILDFSKIEAGKLDLEAVPFDLSEIFFHVLKNLNVVAENKNLQLVSEVSSDLPACVRGDPGRFRQVLTNLIGNAIKFSPEGRVVVRVESLSRSSTESTIRVEVCDTGVGIPPEAVDRIFSPFSQGDASMARRFGGSGLGLSISKQLVEQMGGEIGLMSELGKGSTFWFILPFQHAAPAMRETQRAVRLPEAIFCGGKIPKVLVAEDNKVNQIVTVRMLEAMGCSPVVAENGLKVLECLVSDDFDLILMDCQMPYLDGLETTKRIRADSSSRNHGIPIIAMTANAMRGDEEQCLSAGMDAYLPKPISTDGLANAVTRWLVVGEKRMVRN